MSRPIIHKIILFLFVLGMCQSTQAQTGFYVPDAGKVFFSGDSSTIFSNVINKGNLGVGKNATVNFTGQRWENDPKAMITDESHSGSGTSGDGGWIRFLSDSIRQQVLGGYNAATKKGASFNKFKVQNSQGVELLNSSAKVRKEVNFSKGHFYLNEHILVVGNKDPGKITGYDSTKFFVTNNKAGNGLLVRENIKSNDRVVTFPVGSHENSYTPAALQSRSHSGDDYYITVFDSVRSNVLNGMTLINESVNKTWQVGKTNRPGTDRVDVILQHLLPDEGSIFAANRQIAYVSQYNGSNWDQGFPETVPYSPGYLTTGALLKGSGVNKRSFIGSVETSSYFTALTSLSTIAEKTKLWFNAYRTDTGHVKVYWKTNPEVNVKTFVIQRRLSTENDFSTVGSLPSQAANGYSVVNLDYSAFDNNNYRGISYYRLMLIPYSGAVAYSDTVIVGPQIGLYNIMLWPNPAVDQFNLSWHKTLPVKSIVVWNVLGQKLRAVDVTGQHYIQMRGLIPGTYFVSLILSTNVIIETKKLVVVGGD